jgi:hypothetical protein
LRQDPGAVLFQEWSAFRNDHVEYCAKDNWDHLLRQGIQLLERFVQDDRVRVRQPRRNLQIKFTRPISATMTSSPMSTRSANLMATVVCWNGRPLRAGTQKSATDCYLSTRNWSAIHGLRALPMSRRLCSSVREWLKSSTCARRLRMNSEESSVI